MAEHRPIQGISLAVCSESHVGPEIRPFQPAAGLWITNNQLKYNDIVVCGAARLISLADQSDLLSSNL